jgi:heme O synthase-like polyprenyltransferase
MVEMKRMKQPHFMLIATKWRDDYAAGGYVMRSLDDPSGRRSSPFD